MTDAAAGQQREPFGGRSSEEFRRVFLEKMEPQNIRSTLAFAGLYQITHEMLKQAIFERVRDFYSVGFHENGLTYDETRYQQDVIEAARAEGWFKSEKTYRFTASAAWLVRMDAITKEQADRLKVIYNHRHDLTHELVAFIVDPDRNPDPHVFVDAVGILRDVHRFWVSVERDIGMFDHLEDVSLDDVAPASLLVLQQYIDAYFDGRPN
ncbi:hypothetical protein [Kocuria nitroreducens]|uniref:hypothetical protein n=1 Tax=Kocuria nitroreducens TaxID=3058914 RepID=UPI0036DC3341